MTDYVLKIEDDIEFKYDFGKEKERIEFQELQETKLSTENEKDTCSLSQGSSESFYENGFANLNTNYKPEYGRFLEKKARIRFHREMKKSKLISDENTQNKNKPIGKKDIQKIKNRISAQASRDRKRDYILNLEAENRRLKAENSILTETISKMNFLIKTESVLVGNPYRNYFLGLLSMMVICCFCFSISNSGNNINTQVFNTNDYPKANSNNSIITIEDYFRLARYIRI